MKKTTVLIVGVGSIGERHLRCFGHTDRAELSICEINDSLRQQIAERYSVSRAVRNLDEVLDEPPDAAVICTPAHLHVQMAIALAEAGVHLLIEKPLSTSLIDIDQLRVAAAKKHLTVAVAYVHRVNPTLAQMREAIRSGRFGSPIQLVAVGGQHFPHYRPAYRDIYYNNRATGGGAIQDGLTHIINAAEWLVGPVTKVAADADHQVLEGVDVEDTVHVIARHGHVQASYCFNQHQAPNESTISVICERGTVRFEGHRHRWRWVTEPEQPWHNEVAQPVERDEFFNRQAHMFLDAIQHGSPVACTMDEAEQTLRVNLAIVKAADTGTWQTVS